MVDKMEVENSSPALPLPHTNNKNAAPPQISLDDFLARNPPPAPAISKKKAQPPIGLQAVGARSSKNTVLFHERCQGFAIPLPKFEFVAVGDAAWSGTVHILGETLDEDGPLPSKQEVKEALSGQALEVMRKQEEDGTLRKPIKAKGKKKAAPSLGESVEGWMDGVEKAEEKVDEEKEPFVNYTGKLLEFQRSRSAPQPTYLDYRLGVRFACTCTVDGFDTPFGSTDTLFPSKKAARQNAAKCAVEHFKAEGLWPEETEFGTIKKKGKKGIPPGIQPTLVGVSNGSMNGVGNESESGAAAGAPSYASQVTAVALELGLGTPEWRYAEEAVKDFHTVACYFKVGGVEKGPVGEVRHIYGRKRAKEECAEVALGLLLTLRQTRRDQAMKMMEGMSGSGIGSMEGVERNKEAVNTNQELDQRCTAHVEEEMDLDDSQLSDDLEFEDAEEELVKGDV